MTLQVHVIPEGAGEAAALLGCIRLVDWLAQPQVLGPDPLTLVLDCGTGTTATGRCFFILVKVSKCRLMIAHHSVYWPAQSG